MRVRTAAAVAAGFGVAAASRALRRGGGTALPGLIAERLAPSLIADLGQQLGRGSVLVTGTNGKTTTSRMLASVLARSGIPVLHNREGSNLTRGLASALVSASGVLHGVRGGSTLLGLFEVDEATLPAASAALQPRAIAFTNLFRDQLDRYGEVDSVFARWQEALANTPPAATLVLNADDPSVVELALSWTGPLHWFGVDDPSLAAIEHDAFDARWCGACGGSFVYDLRYFAHVGHWRCDGCGRRRAEPATSARAIDIGPDESTFMVAGLGRARMALTGLYNVYNALAAIAMARVLGLPDAAILAGLADARPAFGRQETIDLQGRRLRLLLSKNPAGANQVVRLLAAPGSPGVSMLDVAVLLNDRVADGQDVSWIWDVDYELLAPRVSRCWAGGDRAEDIALRLTYAGWPQPRAVVHDAASLLDAILRDTRPGETVAIAPTYTAMLDLRAELARRGAVMQFWET
jgi:UDP-N-acetylmuramyl tripeptide synthase